MRQQGRTAIASLAVALLAVGWPAGSRAETLPGSDPAAATVGPSFTCAAGQEPLAQLICSDHDLSRTDLRFVQAYQALRQQSDPAGRAALWREQVAFHGAVLAECSIPATGDLPSVPSGMTACVRQAYEGERQQWLSRLSGPALEEATRPIEEHIAAQRALQAKGFLPATAAIDGVYGPATRAAIVAFQRGARGEATGLFSNSDVAALAQSNTVDAGSSGGAQGKDDAGPSKNAAVPPLAQAVYAGKEVTLRYQKLVVKLGAQFSDDPKACQVEPGHRPTSCKVLAVTGTYDGRPVFVIPGEAADTTERATIAIRRLSIDTKLPQVVFSFDTGGSRCCNITKIATEGSLDVWFVVDDGHPENSGEYTFLDLEHNGVSELIGEDENFGCVFGPCAGSYAPTRILKFDGTELGDVTKAPVYQAFLIGELRKMEISAKKYGVENTNGYLAGWVAQKSLVGQAEDAWQTMFSSYNHAQFPGNTACSVFYQSLNCPRGTEYTIPFSEALAVFLVENSYLTPDQSQSFGYNIAQIQADQKERVAAATAEYEQKEAQTWFGITKSGDCVETVSPSSPADLISLDRSNGLIDTVNILKRESSGKPSIVEVD